MKYLQTYWPDGRCVYHVRCVTYVHILAIDILKTFLAMNAKKTTSWWLANISLSNGLVPSDDKPLAEPMLTKFSDSMESPGINELNINTVKPLI